MFRGFHIGELRALLALLALVFAGLAVFSYTKQQEHSPSVLVAGPSEDYPAGVLAPDSAVSEAVELPSAGLIDINSASARDLEALPGIGPAKSQNIVVTRQRLSGFRTVEELLEVHGIGEKTLQRLRPYVAVETEPGMRPEQQAREDSSWESQPPPTPTPQPAISINSAGFEELQILNGVGPKTARKILDDRRLNGPYRRPADLMRVKGIGPKTVEKNVHLLRFD